MLGRIRHVSQVHRCGYLVRRHHQCILPFRKRHQDYKPTAGPGRGYKQDWCYCWDRHSATWICRGLNLMSMILILMQDYVCSTYVHVNLCKDDEGDLCWSLKIDEWSHELGSDIPYFCLIHHVAPLLKAKAQSWFIQYHLNSWNFRVKFDWRTTCKRRPQEIFAKHDAATPIGSQSTTGSGEFDGKRDEKGMCLYMFSEHKATGVATRLKSSQVSQVSSSITKYHEVSRSITKYQSHKVSQSLMVSWDFPFHVRPRKSNSKKKIKKDHIKN